MSHKTTQLSSLGEKSTQVNSKKQDVRLQMINYLTIYRERLCVGNNSIFSYNWVFYFYIYTHSTVPPYIYRTLYNDWIYIYTHQHRITVYIDKALYNDCKYLQPWTMTVHVYIPYTNTHNLLCLSNSMYSSHFEHGHNKDSNKSTTMCGKWGPGPSASAMEDHNEDEVEFSVSKLGRWQNHTLK